MKKAKIGNQLVDVKVLKTRKLFWIFEQVLVEYGRVRDYIDEGITRRWSECRWIPKSNLIEDYD